MELPHGVFQRGAAGGAGAALCGTRRRPLRADGVGAAGGPRRPAAAGGGWRGGRYPRRSARGVSRARRPHSPLHAAPHRRPAPAAATGDDRRKLVCHNSITYFLRVLHSIETTRVLIP